MTRPDKGLYPITQGFGENPSDYAKFGLKGHNGVDLGVPSGTTLVSPIKGKVTEVNTDPTGYGLYVKVESDSEGSLLAHNQQILVILGQSVDEGQSIAISDNTGNSTGPHCHWGYFRQPRDRQNGYAGYIDPLPFLASNVILPPTVQMNDQTKIPANFLGWDQDLEIQQLRGLLGDFKVAQRRIPELEQQLKDCQTKTVDGPKPASSSLSVLIDELANLVRKLAAKFQ